MTREQMLAAFWLACIGAQLAFTVREIARSARIRRRATPAPREWQPLAAEVAAEVGLRRVPPMLVSSEAATPQVMGLVSPAIVIPARDASRLTREELRMVLFHELQHVRRGDLWLGWIPLVARQVFFFHPLVHIAVREYALAREAACDAAVVGRAEPQEYGRLLVRLGAPRRGGLNHAVGAGAAFKTLKRRLQMLENAKDITWTRWAVVVGGTALISLVPFRLVAKAAPAPVAAPIFWEDAVVVAKAPTPEPVATPAEAAEPVEDDLVRGVPADAPEPSEKIDAKSAKEPKAPKAPKTKVKVVVPPQDVEVWLAPADRERIRAQVQRDVERIRKHKHVEDGDEEHDDEDSSSSSSSSSSSRVALAEDFNGGEGVIFLSSKGGVTVIHGSPEDIRDASKLVRDGDLLWFRHEGDEYVVRDRSLLDRARTVVAPKQKLSSEQVKFGREQAELGIQQAEIGRKMALLGLEEAELGIESAKAELALADLDEDQRDQKEQALHAKMQAKEREIEAKQRLLEKEHRALEKKMRALQRSYEAFEDEHEDEGADAHEVLEELARKALLDGKADKVKSR